MNDPWIPQSSSNVILKPAPADPLHQLISSDRYLESLEKKLGRLKGRTRRDPTPQDIVKSLSKYRDDQMEHFLKGTATQSIDPAASSGEPTSVSYFQRRLYPEKQSVTCEELVVLLQDDALAKKVEEEQEAEELSETDGQQDVSHTATNSVTNASAALETVSLSGKEEDEDNENKT